MVPVEFTNMPATSELCSICWSALNNGEDNVIGHSVQHIFHQECVAPSFLSSRRCPICQIPVSNAHVYINQPVALQAPLPVFFPPIIGLPQFSTLLREAAIAGDLQGVQTLLHQGPAIVSMDDLTVALIRAAQNDHLPVVDALLLYGASASVAARSYALETVLGESAERVPHMNLIVQRLLADGEIDGRCRALSILIAAKNDCREIWLIRLMSTSAREDDRVAI